MAICIDPVQLFMIHSWEALETPAPKDQWVYKYNEHN